MNTSAITTRIADLIRNPNSAIPSDWDSSIKKKQSEPVSTGQVKHEASKPKSVKAPQQADAPLSLSPLAQKILEESDSRGPSEWEKSRNEQVQRIQQLVQDKQYSMHPEVVDSVAQKIVAMLP
jgi:anti-sigma28 factor (negative regulator of flagellin synthesis)